MTDPVLRRYGPDRCEIDRICALSDASEGSMVFCKAGGEKARELIDRCPASLIVIREDVEVEERDERCLIAVENPARWFIQAVAALVPEPPPDREFAGATVEAGARIGAGCRIGAGTFVGASVTIGDNCTIGPNCSLGVSGLAVEKNEDNGLIPYPHLGDVIIGDGVSLGANCVVVRGILETTRIGDSSHIGNMVNIGHNCTIGANCWISSGAVLCGSAVVERDSMIGAAATIGNHVTIGDGATVGAGSVVTKSVQPGSRVFGVPAKKLATMRKL